MNSDLRLADLPAAIHLLPLDPFVLLPETALPITLTAPWARDLLDRARAASGWIGVVQTRKGDGGRSPEAQPYGVGCLARVLDEGRDEDGLHVRLEGVIRFRILGELPADRLKPVAVGYDEFAGDLEGGVEPEGWKLEAFKDKIVGFARQRLGSASVLETMSPRQLVLFLAQTAPLSPAEKQALMEARSLQDLIDTLGQLLALNYLTTTPDTSPPSRAH